MGAGAGRGSLGLARVNWRRLGWPGAGSWGWMAHTAMYRGGGGGAKARADTARAPPWARLVSSHPACPRLCLQVGQAGLGKTLLMQNMLAPLIATAAATIPTATTVALDPALVAALHLSPSSSSSSSQAGAHRHAEGAPGGGAEARGEAAPPASGRGRGPSLTERSVEGATPEGHCLKITVFETQVGVEV